MNKFTVKGIIVSILLIMFITIIFTLPNTTQNTAESHHIHKKSYLYKVLENTNRPLYFTLREYDVNINETLTIDFGIKNNYTVLKSLKVSIDFIDQSGNKIKVKSGDVNDNSTEGFFFWEDNSQQLQSNEFIISSIEYKPIKTDSDWRMYKISLIDDSDESLIADQIIYINIIENE